MLNSMKQTKEEKKKVTIEEVGTVMHDSEGFVKEIMRVGFQEEQKVFENPVFEGSEKRVEIDFDFLSSAPRNGFRSVGRKELDELLKLAACEIVSQLSNALFDSYVLSESSLFVYPAKVVLKTCGTTKLLQAVPRIVEVGQSLGLVVRKCKYSRASFLFPHHQDEIYHDFELEVEYLRSIFKFTGTCGSAYTLGDNAPNTLQWHIFQIESSKQRSLKHSQPTLEVCMTGLDALAARNFFKGDDFVSAQDTTQKSGIKDLVPHAHIDDFVFEPCGYSMNGLLKGGFITVHVTPEDGFSYASVELCRYPDMKDSLTTIEQILDIFKPEKAVVSVSYDNIADQLVSTLVCGSPEGYAMCGATYQLLGDYGNSVWFYSYKKSDSVKEGAQLESPRSLHRAMSSVDSLAKSCWLSRTYDSDTEESCQSTESDRWNYQPDEITVVKDKKADSKLTSVLSKFSVSKIANASDASVDEFARKVIEQRGMDLDMFYVFDLGQVVRLYRYWESVFPRIEACYAVKCMPDRGMISILAAMGAGFDCASESEVDLVLGLGVSPDRIVYANACKRVRDIWHAQVRGVNLTTFDTLSELHKIHQWHPQSNLVIRIRADDPGARCQLGNKYGAELEHTNLLLQEAKDLDLNVVGVSFHVGSGATNPLAFAEAIKIARGVFDQAKEMGFRMKVLDIGGGFMPIVDRWTGEINMGGVVEAVNNALQQHFPVGSGTRIIAEPGRYFAESAATFAANIYGRRERIDYSNLPSASEKVMMDYWIPDGLYGSFNSVMYDHATIDLRPLPVYSQPTLTAPDDEFQGKDQVLCESNVFGPTCDGLDVVVSGKMLPVLQNGDWLMFPNMGAYTLAGVSNFNGINATDVDVFYVSSSDFDECYEKTSAMRF